MIRFRNPIAIAALAAAAIASAQMPGVMDFMKASLIPQSTVVFEVANKAPGNDAQWAAVQKSAAALVDAAKKLESLAPAANAAPWQKFSREMGDAAARAFAAAKLRNIDGVQDAGDTLYETCAGCHQIFLKR